jgi:hypothetical protein
LSSAILYVAIVVIWACVLIPRWLRRDTSVTAAASVEGAGGETSGPAEEEPLSEPAPTPAPAPAPAPAPRRRGPAAATEERRPVPGEDHGAPAGPAHRRVLSARRRLLLMLVGLSVASGVLAGAKMAAWWVIVPPSVMLLGYLLLLRAAAKADAERRQTAGYRPARSAAGPARRPARETAKAPAAAAAAAAPAVPGASGASGAEAKIITIAAAPEPAEEEIYDQYADAKLRAVGD